MASGMRQKPQGSAKDKFRAVDAELKNSQMAARITQMMVQQLVQNNRNMSEDVSKLFQQFTELQYKFLGLQKHLAIDVEQLGKVTNELRLADFHEASDKEDLKEGFTTIDAVEDDSTVILTSTTGAGQDAGIFRSRVKLTDTGSPELIQALAGKPVGTKASVKLNGVDHEVELLGVRRPKAEEAAPAPEALKAVENT